MKMINEILKDSVYFGVAISVFAYWIGCFCKKKWNYPVLNPLLISMLLIIPVLLIFHIDYETYDYGAKYITYFLTPATVCLAVPLYRQVQVLKENITAVIAGTVCGCLAHAGIIVGVAILLKVDQPLVYSFLPKSVTTPIALGICNEIQGISAITVIGVVVAGITGAVLGPTILKLIGVTEPAAQGLALGTASHAVGTSKAIEMGEVQAAMSSLAIVVTGIMTVILVPVVVNLLSM
ncbi:MAG: LrgB family protein [Lachnospiraceae bacterium]|nr:LrgB family protein [Lachnospiraceae bacterium]